MCYATPPHQMLLTYIHLLFFCYSRMWRRHHQKNEFLMQLSIITVGCPGDLHEFSSETTYAILGGHKIASCSTSWAYSTAITQLQGSKVSMQFKFNTSYYRCPGKTSVCWPLVSGIIIILYSIATTTKWNTIVCIILCCCYCHSQL